MLDWTPRFYYFKSLATNAHTHSTEGQSQAHRLCFWHKPISESQFWETISGSLRTGLFLPQSSRKTESHFGTCSPQSVGHPGWSLEMSLLENEAWFSWQVLAFCFKEINPCLENHGGCDRNAECTQTGPNQVSSAPASWGIPKISCEQTPGSWEQRAENRTLRSSSRKLTL